MIDCGNRLRCYNQFAHRSPFEITGFPTCALNASWLYVSTSVLVTVPFQRWGADETSQNEEGRTAAEVVGIYAVDNDGTTAREREDQVYRVRRLLREAPADRAWRRRGFVVLCRRRSLAKAPPTEASTGSREQGDGQCVKMPRTDLATTSVNASAVGGDNSENLFKEAFCLLIQITEEELFRYTVQFL